METVASGASPQTIFQFKYFKILPNVSPTGITFSFVIITTLIIYMCVCVPKIGVQDHRISAYKRTSNSSRFIPEALSRKETNQHNLPQRPLRVQARLSQERKTDGEKPFSATFYCLRSFLFIASLNLCSFNISEYNKCVSFWPVWIEFALQSELMPKTNEATVL